MSSSRGVLDRLASAAAGTPSRPSLEQSVLEHLRALLNTRAGGSEAMPGYGVPDLVDYLHNFPGGVRDLQRALQQAISRGEPRLKNVVVRPLQVGSHELELHFEVTAQVVAGDRRVRFDTLVSSDRRITVR